MNPVGLQEETSASADTKTSVQQTPSYSHDSDPAAATQGVVIIGNDFQALGVVRALTAAGIPAFLVACERGIAQHSLLVKRFVRNYKLLDDQQPEAGVSFLIELAEQEQLEGWALFCVADETVEFLAKNHARLSRTYKMPVPAWETTEKFFKKNLAHEVARSAGVATPKQFRCESLEQLLSEDLEFPLVLKPTFKKNYYEKTHDKAILVKDREQLSIEYRRMNSLIPSSQILAQEFLRGGTENLFSYAVVFDGNEVVSGLSAIRLRQHPMDFGHATTYAEVRDIPELKEAATKFLKALNYRGVAEVEFMYDERTKQYKFLEMNGRFWGWHSLTFAAGLNLPRDLFLVLQDRAVPQSTVNLDATWIRLITDAPTVLREVVRGKMSVRHYLRTFFNAKNCAVWSWRDPLPFLVELMIAPYLWWKKGF